MDCLAKLQRPNAVYSDLTLTCFVGREGPQKYVDIFEIVAQARDAAIARVQDAFRKHQPLQGWQVDDAARGVIDKAGYGQYFCHRTGHSIGQETHGNGANMDNLETREERRVLPRKCLCSDPREYRPELSQHC